MSEEGEAEFDAGQILDEQATFGKETETATNLRATPAGAEATNDSAEVAADARSVHSSSGSRRGEGDSRYVGERGGRGAAGRSPPPPRWGRHHDEGDGHRYRRDERSRSGGRSRGYEYGTYGGGSRADEGDYRRSGSYRPTGSRYGDRDYGRAGYSRQYERDPPPRYRRRDSERQSYGRAPAYMGRDEAVDEFGNRRDVDKDRAIDELRSRVRAAKPMALERSRPESQASGPAQGEESANISEQTAAVNATEQTTAAAAGDANESKDVNMDDLEEGEHIEGGMEVARAATPECATEAVGGRGSSYGRTRDTMAGRSRSGARESRERSRSREYERAYRRDYARDSDSANPRRRYEEYRGRDTYAGRSGHYSRYGGGRSPEVRDSAYRPERRYQASPVRMRSRSPGYARDGDEDRRGRPTYSHRYRPESRPGSPRGMRAYSRSPRHGDQRWHGSSRDAYRSPSRPQRGGAELEPELTDMYGDASAVLPPPPPPPPMMHSSSMHSQTSGLPPLGDGAPRISSPPSRHGSPYRGGYSSRSYRRDTRTPRGGASYEYGGHSRDPSGGGYHAGHGASRGHSPPPPPPPPPPPLAPVEQPPMFPEFRYGTDLHVARHAEAGEWLEARQQLRDHARRVLELSAVSRKTAFELTYAKWGVLKSDSLVQLAAWQLERAEQGLGLSEHTMLDESMDDI
ncbi:hypothetical protein EV175_003814 [Coemansia sp. RSA 1933]|nr:hypothetical protein EV175_003814 [Coemansia sp. RSA 1933]